jgi:restriction system protein
MRPVLEVASDGEIKVSEAVSTLADHLRLSDEERSALLPSGKQAVFANRVHWAKTYLTQAGLLASTKRGHFKITEIGRAALKDEADINTAYLLRFDQFVDFRGRVREGDGLVDGAAGSDAPQSSNEATPDEVLRAAHETIMSALASDVLAKLRAASPAFFEVVIVQLLVSMGYGGTAHRAGRTLGRTGDGGVDGVIDQDPLGVDQIYVQAKLYADGNNIGAGAIRDFFGALNLKRAQKGIFVTTSAFSRAAIDTAHQLGSRIVLIDGPQLSRLLVRYNVGCRVETVFEVKKIDDDFFPD